jgi:hypothetical protein
MATILADTLHLHTGWCCIQPVPSHCDIHMLVLISLWRQHCGWWPCCFIPPPFYWGFCSSTALVVSYSFNCKSLEGHNYPWTDMSRPWSVASGVLCSGFPSAGLSIGGGTFFNSLHFFTQNISHMDCIWTILLHNLMIGCGNWYFIDFSHFKKWQT